MKKDNFKSLMTVLITCFSSLGDVAMCLPIVYPVCRANPKVNFVLATGKAPAGLFINRPDNLIVLGIDLDKYKGIRGLIKLAKNLQHRYNFDAMADLHDALRTKIISATLKRKGLAIAKIDKGRKEKRLVVSGNSREPVASIHSRYNAVFQELGLKTSDNFTSIFECGELPRSPIVPVKEDGYRWIAIAPFSQHQSKEYPLEQMQLVISEISQWEGCHLFLMGEGEKERKALDYIMRRYSNVTSLPHIKHTLADELALLARCDVMLTMDSANMHLASLVGLPTVSVWGGTHPACGFLGWRQALRDTVQLELECRPCSVFGNKKCRYGDYHCLKDISPELIINKVKKVLER